MPIDPLTEETIPLAEAARRLPRLRAGKAVSPATLWRWSAAGCRGVKLETVRVGGTMCTSTEGLSRFFAKLNGQPLPAAPTANARAEKAAKELETIGI